MIYFFDPLPPGIFKFFTLPLETQQNVLNPSKILRDVTKTSENSTYFLEDFSWIFSKPWKFHLLFLQYYSVIAIIFWRLSTFYTYQKINGKKDGKVIFVLKNFQSYFSCILSLIRDLPALMKSTYFDSYWFILMFYLKKDIKRWSVTELFCIKKVL